jgi:type 1 glutamine amidotransferase
MKTLQRTFLCGLALGVALLGASCASTARPSKLRALVVTGGHSFEKEPFLDLFRSFSDVTFTHVEHTNADALLTPAGAKGFDVLVFYDMWQKIDDAAKADYLKLATGGKGFVVLHHAIANYNEWDDYARLLGARYYLRPKTINGVEKARSQYQHDVQIKVKIANPQHPVARGVRDFVIHDETYKGFDVAKDVQPLLKTDEPLSGPVIGWAKQNGRSRWVFIQLGHDHFAYENPNYRQLVHQAIRWVARSH